jgi:RNA polymerase sigma-70 factor, ECF subfamily
MIQDDTSLVAEVLAGERSAFGPLIDRRRPGAIRLARRLLSDPADAEDVVQETFLQAFLCLRDLHDPERFGAWLLGIVVNLCRMRLRARRDEYAFEDWYGGRVVPGFTWADTQPSPEAIYETRELHRLVLDAIAMLPDEQPQAMSALHRRADAVGNSRARRGAGGYGQSSAASGAGPTAA